MNLDRFISAQMDIYATALSELRAALEAGTLDVVHLPPACRPRIKLDRAVLRDPELRRSRRLSRASIASMRSSKPIRVAPCVWKFSTDDFLHETRLEADVEAVHFARNLVIAVY